MKFFNRKKKLPMGTKEQGGPETFKFNSAWNDIDKKFFISLISRKSFHTARLNLEPEEYAVILNRMVATFERQVYQEPKTFTHVHIENGDVHIKQKPVRLTPADRALGDPVDPDDEMKDLAGK